MTYRSWTVHVRRLAGAAVVTAVLAGSAAPAFAADSTTTPTPPRSFSATLTTPATPVTPTTTDVFTRALAATPPATVETSAATPATTPAKAQTSDGFLKSRTGIIVVAIFAVGTGYAMYSAKEDRIHGRNR